MNKYVDGAIGGEHVTLISRLINRGQYRTQARLDTWGPIPIMLVHLENAPCKLKYQCKSNVNILICNI
jgi:hypothetical protein